MDRPNIKYLLFDLPSDHEIESNLITEGELIESVLANNRDSKSQSLKSKVKRIRIVSTARFAKLGSYSYRPQFVHLCGHGKQSGIDLIDGEVHWDNVALGIRSQLKKLPPPSAWKSECERSIIFSCCYSKIGFQRTRRQFAGYFSHAYFFKEDIISFSDALAVWAMFYSQMSHPQKQDTGEQIVEKINECVGEEMLLVEHYPSAATIG